MVKTVNKKSHTKTFFWASVKLIRLPNLIIVGLTILMVYLYLVLPAPHLRDLLHFKVWLLTLAVVLVAAFGYIINDYYDIKIDYINKPRRVVVGRIIGRRTAIVFHTLLNIIAVTLSFFVSWKVFLSVLFSTVLLWYYANALKRKPLIGNLVVSFLTAFSVYLVGFLRKEENPDILLFALFAFMISLIRELIKDMEDIKGDAAFGCKTLPILIGERKTKGVILGLVFLFILMIAIWFYPKSHNLVVYCGVILFPLLIMLVVGILVADSAHRYRRISSLCKWIMLAGVLSMTLF